MSSIVSPNLPPRTLLAFIESYQSKTQTQDQSTLSTTSSSFSSSSSFKSTPSKLSIPPSTSSKMAFGRRSHNNAVVTKTTKPTLMTRLRGRNAKTRTVKTTTTIEPAHATHATHHHHATTRTHRSGWGSRSRHQQPVVQHRRHASLGDKISGAMMRLKGSLTHRPGLKAAGVRRQHGTDGRGSHRVY